MQSRIQAVVATVAALIMVAAMTMVTASLALLPTAGAQTGSTADLGLYDLSYDLSYASGISPELDALGVELLDTTGTSVGFTGDIVTARAIIPEAAVDVLRSRGAEVVEVTPDGTPHPADLQRQASVWKPFDGAGGIREIVEQTAAEYPNITKLVTFGQSVQGRPIQALKVTANANSVADGSRPATVYLTAQHAREWITVETNRRFLDHVVEGYGNDATITALLDTTELWFVLVANPDGYEYTFTNERLWRKNLRDNDNNGVIDFNDGVDLNRNAITRWGYDPEGSSASITSQVYRGPSAGSEPEMVAIDALLRLVNPEFFFNIHSAASLMLYGVGWQNSTPSPDDHVGVALLGDDANPAIEGYNPGVGADLYVVNGDLSGHAHNAHDAFSITMELETCEDAEALLPNDAFDSSYCESTGRSVFEFPDDETLINLVFERNLPLYIAGGQSALTPDDPVSVSGYVAPGLVVQPFDVAHGSTHEVSAEVKRSLGPVTMNYRVGAAEATTVAAAPWTGGERYGSEFTSFYHEVRGLVTGVNPGETVTVWFSAGGDTSEEFTYTVTNESADVLVIADEDYNGFSPEQPGVDAPQYASVYETALAANGYSSNVWDVTAQGVPDPLGVLAQYSQIVWERGDNFVTQTEDDFDLPGSFGSDQAGVSWVHHFVTMAVRDYLNEGGEVLTFSRHLAKFPRSGIGGQFYGRDGDPTTPCKGASNPYSECLLHADDFMDYWLGLRNTDFFDQASGPVGLDDSLGGGTVSISGTGAVIRPSTEPSRPAQYPRYMGESVAMYSADQPAAIKTDSAVAFGFGLEQVTTASAQAQLLGNALELLDEPNLPYPDTALRHVVTCLAGNGRVDTNIVNDSSASADYRLEFAGLTPRQVTVGVGDWARMPITGRPDGPHNVVVKRDGAVVSDTTIMVDCDDDSPSVSQPEVTIMNGCRGGNGYVIAQFANNTSAVANYVVEFASVPNRSTSAAAFGAAARAVTGRPDGAHRMRIRLGGTFIFDDEIVVACD